MNLKDGDYLKSKYEAWGSFYDLNVGYDNMDDIPCRNQLNIINKQHYNNTKTIENLITNNDELDALFIMMNPGSSKPLNSSFKIRSLDVRDISKELLTNPKVPTKPDDTQYQAMRVMEELNWNHILILNLSDIIAAKSKSASRNEKTFENMLKTYGKYKKHSIFSDDRNSEVKSILRRSSTVICAWGKVPFLKKLANQCIDVLKEFDLKIYGEWVYLCSHASPYLDKEKANWLQHIVKQISQPQTTLKY